MLQFDFVYLSITKHMYYYMLYVINVLLISQRCTWRNEIPVHFVYKYRLSKVPPYRSDKTKHLLVLIIISHTTTGKFRIMQDPE